MYSLRIGKPLIAASCGELNPQGLKDFPFTCRKATTDNPLLREMVISFGSAGYVALLEITDKETVTVLAVRHQREDDYH